MPPFCHPDLPSPVIPSEAEGSHDVPPTPSSPRRGQSPLARRGSIAKRDFSKGLRYSEKVTNGPENGPENKNRANELLKTRKKYRAGTEKQGRIGSFAVWLKYLKQPNPLIKMTYLT